MEQSQIKNNQDNFLDSDTFKEIEKQIMDKVISGARRELDLFKFEMIYPQIVSKQEIDEIEEEIVNIREREWKEALKKADGNEEKALMLV
ncbi:unnamed protein product [marine sediment metagenome]|uniref:Uncharacterized protein n=1 Tax=marine sediment metagenome TaxID=412755 RepID=X1UZ63_9ZZZZ